MLAAGRALRARLSQVLRWGKLSWGLTWAYPTPPPASFPRFFQTLKILRQVELINFGDCLVRSRGAVAIAEAVRGGLPKLKVCVGSLLSKGQGGLCVGLVCPLVLWSL